jgi:hypothetical protein
MIRHFLMAVFLAGIFSAMAQSVYRWLTRLFDGRHRATSLATLLLSQYINGYFVQGSNEAPVDGRDNAMEDATIRDQMKKGYSTKSVTP